MATKDVDIVGRITLLDIAMRLDLTLPTLNDVSYDTFFDYLMPTFPWIFATSGDKKTYIDNLVVKFNACFMCRKKLRKRKERVELHQ